MLRKLRVTLQVAIGLAAILALAPSEWVANLGAWATYFSRNRYPLLVILIIILFLRLLALEVGIGFPIRSLAHTDVEGNSAEGQDDVPTMFPSKADKRLRGILMKLGGADPGHPHIVRIWLATGETIIWKGYLEHFFQVLNPKARFDVRILMIDPKSPMIGACGPENWTEQVVESCKRLSDIRMRYQHKRATLEWRTYKCPPMIRAVLLNEEYLLFGFMLWFEEQHGVQLHNQNRSYIYMSRRQKGAEQFIDFVKNWFDHEWESGRDVASLAEDRS
jgi:hypothetical protein